MREASLKDLECGPRSGWTWCRGLLLIELLGRHHSNADPYRLQSYAESLAGRKFVNTFIAIWQKQDAAG